jgi:2-oxo-4-hydroxy-4-carboxy--5-ureidoimidazoline (OHCU) decarboxylase
MKLLICSLLFLLTACLEDNRSPEAALKEFIEIRIGNVVTRNSLVEKVTGKMRQSLENVSDEEFQKFADLRNVQRDSFKVLSKSCQEETCFLTYSISYKTKQEEKDAFASEVKKIAELRLISGKWLISDVTNIKTYHESLEPINALSQESR